MRDMSGRRNVRTPAAAQRGRARRRTGAPFRRGAAGVAGFLLGLCAQAAAASPICPVGQGSGYLGQTVLQDGREQPWVFATDNRLVDADGAPNAYSPEDVGAECGHDGVGLDCLQSAGYPDKHWWRTVLVADPAAPDRPFVQQTGPYRGFFVSMTSLRGDAGVGPIDPRTYVDASQVPYLVMPAPLLAAEGMGWIGDIGYALDLATGRTTPFVVADEGPLEPLGEASIAFWEALGGTAPNARDGGGLTPGRFVAVVFPGSRSTADVGWPIDLERLKAAAGERLAQFGGLDALRACAFAQLAEPEPGVDEVRAAFEMTSLLDASPDIEAVAAVRPHMAAELWDGAFATRQSCAAALEKAIRPDAPEALQMLYRRAECRASGEPGRVRYRVRLRWLRRPVRAAEPCGSPSVEATGRTSWAACSQQASSTAVGGPRD